MSAAVRAGYKLTEVGMIPQDWDELTVGDVIEFQGGSQPEKSVFSVMPRPGFVRLIQIRDYKSNRFEVFAPIALLRRFCDENDIMIGRYGPPVFQILRGLSGAYNVALIKAISRPNIDREFAFYFLKQDSLFEFIEKLSRRSSGQTGVDLSELRQYPLPLPPLTEQRAIAAALSDVDALLAKQGQLIAKKQGLKQAAMQQLLTGQTRLPGFSGDWEVVEFGDIATIRNTKVVSSSTPAGTQCVELESIGKDSGRLLGSFDATGSSSKFSFKKGDVLFGRLRAYLRKYWLAEFDGVCSTEIWPLIPRDNRLYAGFLHLLVQTNGFVDAAAVSYGTHMPRSDWSVLGKFGVQLPSHPEQTAIATTLSDMDTEIAALEERQTKTRALKQGMMQELLTGKTRLV